MRRYLSIALLAAVTFAAGVAAAQAQFLGWTRVAAPCVPTALAMTAADIAVTCPGDRTIYLKPR